MKINPIWHIVSFDIEGVAKSSELPQITTIVPCDNEKDAERYIMNLYKDLLIGREIVNFEFIY